MKVLIANLGNSDVYSEGRRLANQREDARRCCKSLSMLLMIQL